MSFRRLRSTAPPTILFGVFLSMILNTAALAQWSTPVRISEPGGGYYPQIVAQGDTLHVVYENQRQYDKISYIRSTDAGASWSQRIILSDRSTSSLTIEPRIVANDSNIMCIWYNGFRVGPLSYNLGYSVSHDGGLTWNGPLYVLNPSWGRLYYFAAAGVDSLVNIILGGPAGDTGLVYFGTRSLDFGQNWSDPTEIFLADQSGLPDCASFDSLVHFVWDGRFSRTQKVDVYHIQSTDQGLRWLENVALSDTDQFHSQLPSIYVGEIGNLSVTWMDYKYAPPGSTGDIFLRQSNDSGANWTSETQLSFNHTAVRSDIVSEGDTVHVAWQDESRGTSQRIIYYIKSEDGGNTWSDPYSVDATDDDSWDPSLAARNGRVYAIWYDARGGPDSGGLYFSRWQQEPDGVVDGENNVRPDNISISVYPNPFNSTVVIEYFSMKGGAIGIYNSTGQLVRSFGNQEGGSARIVWDATDLEEYKVSSGVYWVKFVSGGHSKTAKVIYVK